MFQVNGKTKLVKPASIVSLWMTFLEKFDMLKQFFRNDICCGSGHLDSSHNLVQNSFYSSLLPLQNYILSDGMYAKLSVCF